MVIDDGSDGRIRVGNRIPIVGGEKGLSLTEDKAPQLFSQRLDLFRIARGSKSFGEVEESTFFLFASFHPLLDEFYQHTVLA
jgi:hypothetical protein